MKQLTIEQIDYILSRITKDLEDVYTKDGIAVLLQLNNTFSDLKSEIDNNK